jgi:putative methyltransferase (TIGR04325 family)
MSNKIRHSWAKNITPPLIWKYIKTKQKYGFFGNFSNWQAAQKLTGGYDSDLIIEKVKNSALKVKNGEAVYERDSVIFDKTEYFWPLLANLLWIASQNNNSLNLIDFGGALGTSYFQNFSFLKHLNELSWNIVEQKKFFEYGQKLFSNKNLHFYETISKCLKEQNANTILLSGVLQYLEYPYEFLKQVNKFSFIIIDRMPLFENDDRIVIQKVPPKIYDASYPCWILNQKKFVDFFTNDLNFELIAGFDSHIGTIIDLEDSQATYKGFIFKKY